VVHKLRQRRVDELPADLPPEVLDGVANLSTAFAEPFLRRALCPIGHTFSTKALVTRRAADAFFHAALHPVSFPTHFVSIPHVSPP